MQGVLKLRPVYHLLVRERGVNGKFKLWIGQEIQSFVLTAISCMLVSDGILAHWVNVQNESYATDEFLQCSWNWRRDGVGEEMCELQNTFVPPQCWAGLGLFSASQGSEHPPGLAHAASHSSCQLGNIWAMENASGVRMFQLPCSQPAPSCLDSTDSRLCCLGWGATLRHSSSIFCPACQAKAISC